MIGDVIACEDIGFIVRILAKLVKLLQFLIPILLIVLVMFDLFKVVTSQADDKAKKDASNKIVQRVIYAIIIFLVPTIINFLLASIIPKTNGNYPDWYSCWNRYYNETLSF